MVVNKYESGNNPPFIGVHVKRRVINLLKKQKVSRNINRLQKMNDIAKTKLYFFSERDVDYNKKKIKGSIIILKQASGLSLNSLFLMYITTGEENTKIIMMYKKSEKRLKK